MKHELSDYRHELEYEPQSLRLECEPRTRMRVIGLVDMHEVGGDDVVIETVPRRAETPLRRIRNAVDWAAALIGTNE